MHYSFNYKCVNYSKLFAKLGWNDIEGKLAPDFRLVEFGGKALNYSSIIPAFDAEIISDSIADLISLFRTYCTYLNWFCHV